MLDQRAHGYTYPLGDVDRLSFRGLSDDVSALLRSVRVDRAVLVGVSMGAGVALRFTLDYPDNVKGLVLVRPAWLDRPMTWNLEVFPLIARLLRQDGPLDGLREFKTLPVYAQVVRQSRYSSESLCAQFLKPSAVERAARLDLLPRCVPYESPLQLRDVTCPVLVLGSRADPIHPIEFAESWADHLRGARYREVVSKSLDPNGHDEAVWIQISEFLSSLQ